MILPNQCAPVQRHRLAPTGSAAAARGLAPSACPEGYCCSMNQCESDPDRYECVAVLTGIPHPSACCDTNEPCCTSKSHYCGA